MECGLQLAGAKPEALAVRKSHSWADLWDLVPTSPHFEALHFLCFTAQCVLWCSVPGSCEQNRRQAKLKQGGRNMECSEELGKGERVREAENLWVWNPWTRQICTTALVNPCYKFEPAWVQHDFLVQAWHQLCWSWLCCVQPRLWAQNPVLHLCATSCSTPRFRCLQAWMWDQT